MPQADVEGLLSASQGAEGINLGRGDRRRGPARLLGGRCSAGELPARFNAEEIVSIRLQGPEHNPVGGRRPGRLHRLRKVLRLSAIVDEECRGLIRGPGDGGGIGSDLFEQRAISDANVVVVAVARGLSGELADGALNAIRLKDGEVVGSGGPQVLHADFMRAGGPGSLHTVGLVRRGGAVKKDGFFRRRGLPPDDGRGAGNLFGDGSSNDLRIGCGRELLGARPGASQQKWAERQGQQCRQKCESSPHLSRYALKALAGFDFDENVAISWMFSDASRVAEAQDRCKADVSSCLEAPGVQHRVAGS